MSDLKMHTGEKSNACKTCDDDEDEVEMCGVRLVRQCSHIRFENAQCRKVNTEDCDEDEVEMCGVRLVRRCSYVRSKDAHWRKV